MLYLEREKWKVICSICFLSLQNLTHYQQDNETMKVLLQCWLQRTSQVLFRSLSFAGSTSLGVDDLLFMVFHHKFFTYCHPPNSTWTTLCRRRTKLHLLQLTDPGFCSFSEALCFFFPPVCCFLLSYQETSELSAGLVAGVLQLPEPSFIAMFFHCMLMLHCAYLKNPTNPAPSNLSLFTFFLYLFYNAWVKFINICWKCVRYNN